MKVTYPTLESAKRRLDGMPWLFCPTCAPC